MKTNIEKITPDTAAKILETHSKRISQGHFNQRGIRDSVVRRYAQDMSAGQWRLTHQGLAFDENGDLVDGQHRLMAIVRSGVSLEMMVTRGMPIKNSIDAFDTGCVRSVANQLQIQHGFKDSAWLAGCVRMVAQLCSGSAYHVALTSATTVWMLEHLGFQNALERLRVLMPDKKKTISFVAAPWVLYWCSKPTKAEQFARSLFLLEDLGKGHPILALNHYLSEVKNNRRPRDRYYALRIVCNALHTFHEGSTISLFAIKPSKEAQVWLLELNSKLVDQVKGKVAFDLQ